MSIPPRGRTSGSTYFITADCWEKKRLLQSERMANLLIDVLYHYRAQKKYLLHEFVVMPHHFHLLITPTEFTLERYAIDQRRILIPSRERILNEGRNLADQLS